MATHEAVDLRVGDEHSVVLEGLMTAGYVWEPRLISDHSIVEVTKVDPETANVSPAVGAGGAETFVIKALMPGTTRVRFAQRRPRDHASQADEHVVDLRVAE
jgi:predicted secreted protein